MEQDSQADSASVERRIRGNLLDWQEMVLSVERGPLPFDLNELINQWFDWNPDVPDATTYPAPIYIEREAESLIVVGIAVNLFCEATPKIITDEAAASATVEWAAVIGASERARAQMLLRGGWPDRN